MRKPFLFAYTLVATLGTWSLVDKNHEFLIYAIIAFALVTLIHLGDRKFAFGQALLWGFNLWLLLHIFGGLWQVGDGVLYSLVLIDIVGEPYSILKYDQLVHVYCYFIIALLLWRVIAAAGLDAPRWLLTGLTVLAASGVGGLNEIVEFAATVLVPDTNVGGYENTAIDLVANLLGACLAIPFFKEQVKGTGRN
ncbi:DUF2238 domain-containing protein [Porticoccus sp.]|uniref:DUF2238 domain-containing protein n=1 Tax=Porticoccus sp. TaxID=2024853 RepID=UPI003F69B5D7